VKDMTTKAKKVAAEGLKNFETAVTAAKDQAAKASKALYGAVGDIAEFGKDNAAAVTKANAALVEGFDVIGKELTGYARHSLEQTVEVTTKLISAKTLDEVIQINQAYAKTAFEALVANATKISEIGVKVSNEAFQPLSAHVGATFVKLAKTKQAA